MEMLEADSLLCTKGDITIRAHKALETKAYQENEIKKLQRQLETSNREIEDIANDAYNRHKIFKLKVEPDSAAYYVGIERFIEENNPQGKLMLLPISAIIFQNMRKLKHIMQRHWMMLFPMRVKNLSQQPCFMTR